MGQEPGTAEEIATFCSTTYGVTFPLAEKVEVNGDGQHPLYAELTEVADAEGKAGDVAWNFEKFLVAPGGAGHPVPARRSSPRTRRSSAPSRPPCPPEGCRRCGAVEVSPVAWSGTP